MMTLSIVSHRQGPLVTSLLVDIARLRPTRIAAIVVTRNVPEAEIEVPDALRSITTMIDNGDPHGFGANHNAAFVRCATPLFAVINPDIRLEADPFERLADRFDDPGTARGRVALVAPRIVAPDGRDEDAARELITPWRLLVRRLGVRRPADRFDWLAGMFLVVRSDAFHRVGGFDPRYFMYCEDFDLCARLRLDNWTIERVDDVRAIHAARRDSHRSWRHLAWHVTSLCRMWTSSAFWRYRAVLGGLS